MNFRTRIDFTNRQAKQYEKTDISLSGGTVFGLPYSALTTGPDLSMTGVTDSNAVLQSTYSGNTGTTVYTWGDSRMAENEGELSAITPSNSGTTQGPTGPNWEGYDMFTTEDGYTGWTSYSAVTYDVKPLTMVDLGGGGYSGVVQSDFHAYSASSLDYTGSTIWVDVSGITRTDELVVKKGAVAGYVLTAQDSSGKLEYTSVSAVTSGDTYITGGTFDAPSSTLRHTRSDGVNIDVNLSALTDTTFWEETGTGDTALKDIKGSHTIVGTSDNSMVAGGLSGYVEDSLSAFIGGGVSNTVVDGRYGANVGGFSNTVSAFYAANIGGQNNEASGANSLTSGDQNIASNDASVAFGNLCVASGSSSFAVGISCNAGGTRSQAMGWLANASGIYAHAQGVQTEASGESSFAAGRDTLASGHSAHVTGRLSIAGGDYSSAEGYNNYASGDYSHAEGKDSIASGSRAHAEGDTGLATGFASHAEGGNCEATGTTAHAEGNTTYAYGEDSHSQNRYCTALGDYSHAGGRGRSAFPNRIEAGGVASFIHFGQSAATGTIGAYGDYSVILGGLEHNIGTGSSSSVILGGEYNVINDDVLRSVVIGGQNITASTADMVYVPDLVIDGLTSVTDLQTDANGQIIDGASDITLKDNVETLENPLEKVLALNPVSFEWKPEMNLREGKVFGLIAQEVKEVIPEIVRERAKGNGTLTLEYKEIIPWLVGAVQQLASGYETTGLKDNDSELKTDKYGRWIASPALSSKHLILPEFTPTSTNDERGTTGDSVWDDDYIYIKTNGGWKRSSLENF